MSKTLELAWQLGLWLLVAYGIFIGLMWAFQERLLYLPDTASGITDVTPADSGLTFETLSLRTDDGETLHGWFVPGRHARATLIFFHGNAGHIGHRLHALRFFNELGLSVIMVDYRGYGKSTGKPSERGTAIDARAVWRHATADRGIEPRRIVLAGRSLGAAVAARLAAEVEPGALVLQSPFTSIPDLAADIYPWIPARWLARLDYPVTDYAASVKAPALVMHGADDEIIPPDHARRVYAALAGPKRLVWLEGGHNDAWIRDRAQYRQAMAGFLDTWTGPPATREAAGVPKR